jgi:lipid A 3-O-deacylase
MWGAGLERRIWLVFLFIAGAGCASAQENPSRPARTEKTHGSCSWELGVFAQGGFPPSYVGHDGAISSNLDLRMFSAGFEVGRQFRLIHHLGPLSGRAQATAEILPLWVAKYPAQNINGTIATPPVTLPAYHFPGKSVYGSSITPVLLRWSFVQSDPPKMVPWLQLGGGVLWTNHEFPIFRNTSVFNFTPQAGAGINVFMSPRRSVDLAFKFIHISNAGLGDENPAIHDTVNFALGYSWWR